MYLSEAKPKEKLIIVSNLNNVAALRFGLVPRAKIQCLGVIPRGPIIIQLNRQVIAIGRQIAKTVEVERRD